MKWEQHRFAAERARDRMDKLATDLVELCAACGGGAAGAHEECLCEFGPTPSGLSLQSEAARSDAELLDEVAQFLRSLDGGKRGDPARETFVADWNKMIAGVSVMCSMYELPEPVMVFNPSWLNRIRSISGAQIRDTLIYANVKVRFAIFEQAEVLRTV